MTSCLRLPERPRLAPGVDVYDRGANAAQIGLDARRAVAMSGVPPGLLSVLSSLDGRLTLRDVLARVRDADHEQARDLLAALAERGLLEDGSVADPVATASVVVAGDGPIAVEVACLLAAEGVGRIVVESEGVVAERDVGLHFTLSDVGLPRREVLQRKVRAISPSTSTRASPSGGEVDLVVLTDAVVVEPALVRSLMCERRPHLPVRFRDATAVVGPLVAPGRTSCLRCADFGRAARDPAWPIVASQLVGRSRPVGHTAARTAAGLAVAQVLRALRPSAERPAVWNAALELHLDTGTVETRRWPPHPRCDCEAAWHF